MSHNVPSVLKNQENYPPRYAHDLAVGPAAHSAGFVQLTENLEKGTFWKKIRENLETQGIF